MEGRRQMALARHLLSRCFIGIRFTRTLTSPACPGEGIYSNMLAEFDTDMERGKLVQKLKHLEQQMGDTAELRREGKVMMDIDILCYGDEKHHLADWERPYIKRLLRYAMKMVAPHPLCHERTESES